MPYSIPMHVVFTLLSVCVSSGAPNHEIQKPMEPHKICKLIFLLSWKSPPVANIAQLTFMLLFFSKIRSYLHRAFLLQLLPFSSFVFPAVISLPHFRVPSPSSCSSLMCHPCIWHFSSLPPQVLPLLPFPPFIFLLFSSCFLPITIFYYPHFAQLFSLVSTFTLLFCQVSHPLPSSATNTPMSFLSSSSPLLVSSSLK